VGDRQGLRLRGRERARARARRTARTARTSAQRGDVLHARTDQTGAALDGTCRYEIRGGRFDARWWSITLYDRAGWLVANPWHRHSVGSAAVPPESADAWTISVAPAEHPGLWIPSTGAPQFELTMRLYHPGSALRETPQEAAMPEIRRIACGA
jgi:hypothetical protein